MKIKLVAGEVEQRLLYMHYEYFRPLDPRYWKQDIFRIPKRNAEERLFLRWEYWHIKNPNEMSKPIYAHEFMDSLDDERMRTDREIINTYYKSYNYDEVLRPTMEISNFMQNTLPPIGGLFTLVFEAGTDTEDNFFWQWFKEGKLLNGYIEIEKYPADYSAPIRIEFWDCFVTSCQQEYAWDTPMLMGIRLSPAITRNRRILQTKRWNRTDPDTLKQEYKSAVIAFEAEPKKEEIISCYFENENGKQIERVKPDKTVYYVFNTKNCIGKTVSINLSDDNIDYEYKGKHVESDLLKGIKITSNMMKIKLQTQKQR